jgi:tRNA G18 (ribose-2'-O)-methylase SpoU
MQPGNESLNAAAATAIALYLWSRQQARPEA